MLIYFIFLLWTDPSYLSTFRVIHTHQLLAIYSYSAPRNEGGVDILHDKKNVQIAPSQRLA